VHRYTLPADLDLKQINNDSETVTNLNIGQYFSDPDGHPLTFTATGLPPGLSIDPNTGVISGTLDRSASQGGQGGVYTVVVTANDPYGGSVDLPFTWTALNPPPEAADDQGTTEENTVLEVPKEKGLLSNDHDPDGDDLVVTDIENADGLRVSPGTPIAGSNGGTLVVNPDGSYTFTPGTDFDYLAEGETTTVEFEYTISDGEGGTDKAKLVITITGTNDAPVINGAGTDDTATVVEIEDNAAGENQTLHQRDGTITFTDADTSDVHTVSYTPQGDEYRGQFTATLDSATRTVQWTFTVQDQELDNLAEGQTLVQQYVVSIDDGKGGVVTQTVTVTIVGSNDAPIITSEANEHAGSVTEDAVDNTATGQLSYDDADNAQHDSQSWSLVDPDTGAQSTRIEGKYGYIELDAQTGKWVYTLDNDRAATNALKDNQQVTETFTARVTDQPGAFAEQEIVITIHGKTDRPPLIEADDANGTAAGHITVSESGLVNDGQNVDSHIASGTILLEAADGLASIKIGDQTFTLAELQALSANNPSGAIDVGHGTIVVTGFTPGTSVGGVPTSGSLSYTYTLSENQTHKGSEDTERDFAIPLSVTDAGGETAKGSLVVNVQDDTPTANADTNSVTEDTGSVTTGNVLGGTGASAGDVADREGADGATLTHVKSDTANGVTQAVDGLVTVQGKYGTLVLHKDGQYTYTLNNDNAEVNALKDGKALEDVFRYTLTDGDGDTSTATLTITINGTTDGEPEITADDGNGKAAGHITVSESGLVDDGQNVDSHIANGTITLKAADGLASIMIGDQTFTLDELQALSKDNPSGEIDVGHGTIVVTGFTPSAVVGGVPTSGSLSYTYTLSENQTHKDTEDTERNFDITLSVTDAGGVKTTGTLTVNVQDDTPTANNDTANVLAGQMVLDGGTHNVMSNDREGADGATVTAVGVGNSPSAFEVVPTTGDSVIIKGQYGTLTLSADGKYSYERDPGTPGNVQDVFTYRLTDGDGDQDTATLTISIGDAGVSITELTPKADGGDLTVHEKHLSAGTAPDGNALTQSGSFKVSAADGIASLTIGGKAVITDNVPSNFPVTHETEHGTLTVTGYDPITQEVSYTYTLKANQTHIAGNGANALFDDIAVQLKDMDGDQAQGTLSVRIVDDVPEVSVTGNVGTLLVDESALGTSVKADFSNLFHINHGADGAAENNGTVYALTVGAGKSGLVDSVTGDEIVLVRNAQGIIEGRVGGESGDIALTISINPATGEVTLTQLRGVKHPTDKAEISLNPDSLQVSVTATDTDGDSVSKSVNVGGSFSFKDGAPTIEVGVDASSVEALLTKDAETVARTSKATVDFSKAFTATPSAGADGQKGTTEWSYALAVGKDTSSGLTSAGQSITLSLKDGVVQGKVGDTLIFTVSVDANGKVTLEQHKPIDHANAADSAEILRMAKDKITLTATATVTDNDGDTASASKTLDLGEKLSFQDDGPSIGTPTAATVAEEYLSSGSAAGKGDLTVKGDLAVDFGAETSSVDTKFTEVTIAHLESLGLTSGKDQSLKYVLSPDGHTVTATAAGKPIFTVTITDHAGKPGYEFTLQGAINHEYQKLSKDLNIPFTVKDADGDTASSSFTVTIQDDVQQPTQTIETPEDKAITFNTTADGSPSTMTKTDGKYGEVSIGENGKITYTPKENYSGPDSFTYTTVENGVLVETTVTVNVTPVADAPELALQQDRDDDNTDPSHLVTKEDVAVILGFTVPKVTDGVDQSGPDDDHDNPERLGEMVLSGFPEGAVVIVPGQDGNPDKILTPDANGNIRIQFTGPETPVHIKGIEQDGIVTLTKAEFEGLQVLPPPENSKDFTVTGKVVSYEVDSEGNRLKDANGKLLDGAETEVTVRVEVRAITDPILLEVVGGKDGVPDADDTAGKSKVITLQEDAGLNLKDYLKVSFPADYEVGSGGTVRPGDGNSTGDFDGSEDRWFEIKGLPKGSVIESGGHTYKIENGMIKVPAAGLSTSADGTPDMKVKLPKDFSGEVKDVKVTFVAVDRDPDDEKQDGVREESSITLTLDVAPIADRLDIGRQEGDEDTRIPLLSNVKLGDTDGSEKLTALTIKGVPVDWEVRDAAGHPVSPTSTENGLNSYKLPTNSAGVVDLKDFSGWTVQPPPQSSKDGHFKLEYTIEDHKLDSDGNTMKDVDGNPIIHTKDFVDNLTVTVIPVAERVETKEDGHSGLNHGLTMTEGHDYSEVVGGKEDTAFALNVDGFDLGGNWVNPDAASEETFALLKPILDHGLDSDKSVVGAVFTYTDEKGTEHKVVYTGQEHGVEIPLQYLHTVTFTPPPHVAGEFKIQVQAKTVDTKEDDPSYKVEAISGEAWLTGIKIEPVADEVASLGISPASGKEDSAIALSIRPSSSDSSETFNVKIDKIPADATLQYGDQKLTADSVGIAGLTVEKNKDGSWSVVINNFDSNADLFVTPPHNSNADFSLTVSAQTVDALDGYQPDVGAWKTQELPVRVQGVADTAEVIAKADDESVDYTEASVEANGGITLGDLIANVSQHDDDGSEQLSFRITGLDGMFSLEGATFLGGEGTERVWVVSSKEALHAVKVITPEHFSGTVKVTVTPVTTENDGDWKGSPSTDLIATVTPSPEAVGQKSGSLIEDTKQPIHFGLDTNNGDLDEKVTAVFIKAEEFAAKGFILYLGDQLLEDAVQLENGYYVLRGDQLTQLTGQATTADFAHNQGDKPFSFTVKYEITDYSTDGTVDPVVQVSPEQEYTLTVSAVTDPVELGEVSVVGVSPNIDITTTGNKVALGSTGSFAVNLQLAKTDGAGVPTDNDGSERFTQVVVEGVPDGVVVEGLKVGDHSIGQVSYLGNGKWLVTISEAEQPTFTSTGGINAQLQFRAGASVGSASGDIKITVVTKDTDASSLETDSVTLGFESTLPDGSGNEPAVQVTWTPKDDVVGQEDTAFTLSELGDVTLSVTNDDGNDLNFAVTVKVPEGSAVQVDGVPVVPTQVGSDGSYVILVTGKGDEQALKDLLSKIEVTPPANLNTNLGEFTYEVGITAYHPDSSSQSETTALGTVPLTPVTDGDGVSITLTKEGDASASPEEGSPVAIQISIGSGVDGLSVLGDKLYIKLGEANFSGSGVLKDAEGKPLVVQHLSADPELGLAEGDYYVLDVPADTTVGAEKGDYVVNLTYQPSSDDKYTNGSLTVDAWVQKTEQGSEKTVMVEGANTATLQGISNGYEIFVGEQVGDVWEQKGQENQDGKSQIKLNISGKGLLDTDGSEEVYIALLKNLPNGFLVFYGNSAEDAKLAQNAGAGDGDSALWTLPLQGGQLPSYVAIVPPKNWSGTLKDLELSVLNGEKGGVVRDDVAKFDLSIEAVADGIYSMNTAPAFGREGEIIRLNLNIMLKDGLPVESEATDQSVERLSLELTGLGEHAAFYVGDTLLAFNGEGKGFSYDADKGTYKVYGLSQQDIDSLGVLQTKPVDPQESGSWKVTFDAWTEESSNGASSGKLQGEFDITLQTQKISAEDDKLLFDGTTLLDGGKGDDTVWLRFGEDIDFGQYGENDQPDNLFKNIEAFDLTREGFDHSITNLSVQDVLDITDGRNVLTIKADHGDTITLGDGWVKDDSKSKDGIAAFKGADGKGELLIESTDAELLKAVADSLKDKSM